MRPSAYRTWLFLSWVTALINTTVFTTAAIYFVRDVGANPLQLVLIGTVMEFAIFLFELPTGAFADSHGRRASVVISYVIEGTALLIVAVSTSYIAVLVAYVIWGVGSTFSSGALEAWITDEMEGRDLEKVFLRGGQFYAAGQLAGFVVAAIASNIDLALPFAAGGVISVVFGAMLVALMREDHWTPGTARGEGTGSFRRLRATAIEGVGIVRTSHLLLAVLAFVALLGMYTESFDRLWEAHMLGAVEFPALAHFRPVVWFAIIGAVELLVGIVVMGRVAARFTYTGPQSSLRSLRLLVAIQFVGLLVFALTSDFYVAVVASFSVGLARGIGTSLFSAWLNRQIESSHRATVLSIVNQSDAVGQWLGGPAIGAVGTVLSLRWALSLGAVVLLPAAALLRKVQNHLRPAAEPSKAAAEVLLVGEVLAGGGDAASKTHDR